jgi:formylglycine-generating enzyme required for sulfatase activity
MYLKTKEERLKNMIIIEGGSYLRGSSESPDEGPVMQVTVDKFAIDITPVTNKDYRVFVENRGYQNPDFWTMKGWEYKESLNLKHPNFWLDSHWNKDDSPVTGVSFWEALAFAKFSGKTLPTEAQWEFACKGFDQRKYSWGNEAPSLEYAYYAPDCIAIEGADLRSSTSVYAHPKNKSYFGCLDMAGNMGEWCLDNASTDYSWDKTGYNPIYITSEEDYHIFRGGSGLHSEEYLRCTSRDYYPPSMRDDIAGFRCVVNDL